LNPVLRHKRQRAPNYLALTGTMIDQLVEAVANMPNKKSLETHRRRTNAREPEIVVNVA
jgi:hypothetical protein